MEARRAHWERVYGERSPSELSWFQAHAGPSLDLIERSGVDRSAPLLDVGGGASTLVDALLERGFTDLSVLDLSERALGEARARLGDRAASVSWICDDVTTVALERTYRVWHDRAVFHFLVEKPDRERYRALLHRHLEPGGHAIVATFALDGPERCSGLPVARYSAPLLEAALGPGLVLEDTRDEEHHTPAGRLQRFVFCRFRREA